MRKAVGQSVNNRLRQADSKETATDFGIGYDTVNLIQTPPWNLGVCVQEPENIAAGRARPGVHLFRTAALVAPDKVIAQPRRKLIRAVGARAIDHNDFRSTRSLAEMLEKRAYQRRLVKDRNNNRDLH